MPFIDRILKCKSLSIVGMEKNTGKTEALNYILGRLPSPLKVSVTSIGIDGERVDQVTETAKPEIYLKKGMIFGTAERFYRSRMLVSEVLDVGFENTSMGRIVTAEVVCGGKVLISGPSSAAGLERWNKSLDRYGVSLKIIDGALSRLSSASPAISEAMILTTGAALSANIDTLVSKTLFTVNLTSLPKVPDHVYSGFRNCEGGIWTMSAGGQVRMLEMPSSFSVDALEKTDFTDVEYLYVSGAVTERFLNKLRGVMKGGMLVVRDFTRFFVSRQAFASFMRAGNGIGVMNRTELLAVCVNPVSPAGFVLDSDRLVGMLREKTDVTVCDLRRI